MGTHARSSLETALVTVPADHRLRRVPRIATIVGAVLLVAAAATALFGDEESRTQFFSAYLAAFAFVLSLSLGALIFVLLQWVCRAGWSVTVRRVAENMMGVLPWCALLFVPVLFGMHELFEWTHEDHVAHDPILQTKAPYLNVPFFLARAVVYFVAWAWMGRWFRRQSILQDATGEHATTRRLQWWSGPCILIYALTVSFAAFDWFMSLQPHWYSTIWGGYYFAGALVGALAVMTLTCLYLKGAGFLGDGVNQEHFHDLGKLLFAFVVFWAYLAFSQYFLIWYGNIPEETMFFHHRFEGSWLTVSVVLMVGHFVLPFLYLMPRTLKRIPVTLWIGAAYMLVLHYVDMFWLVRPVAHPEGADFLFVDFLCVLGLSAVWLGLFVRLLVGAGLVPTRDPRLPEALAFENF